MNCWTQNQTQDEIDVLVSQIGQCVFSELGLIRFGGKIIPLSPDFIIWYLGPGPQCKFLGFNLFCSWPTPFFDSGVYPVLNPSISLPWITPIVFEIATTTAIIGATKPHTNDIKYFHPNMHTLNWKNHKCIQIEWILLTTSHSLRNTTKGLGGGSMYLFQRSANMHFW